MTEHDGHCDCDSDNCRTEGKCDWCHRPMVKIPRFDCVNPDHHYRAGRSDA